MSSESQDKQRKRVEAGLEAIERDPNVHSKFKDPEVQEGAIQCVSTLGKVVGYEYKVGWRGKDNYSAYSRNIIAGWRAVGPNDPEAPDLKDETGARRILDGILLKRPVEVGEQRRKKRSEQEMKKLRSFRETLEGIERTHRIRGVRLILEEPDSEVLMEQFRQLQLQKIQAAQQRASRHRAAWEQRFIPLR